MRYWAILLPLLIVCTICRGQESSALINRELDKQVKKLELDGTLPQAMEIIADKTGVRLKEDPVIWELLPWGRETTVVAKIENITLREALLAITRTLGLSMVLRDEYIELQPMPGLRRLGQRASPSELKALEILSSRALGLGTDRPTVKQLLEAVDLKLAAEQKAQLAVENRIGELVPQDKVVFVPRNATLMEALESLPKETKGTWYPWANNVVVVSKEERTRRLLQRPISFALDERGMDVMDMLSELSQRTGVGFEYQPGVIQVVPMEARNIRGTIDNAPAQQVLERIAASTGLAYSVQDERVYIGMPANPAQQAGGQDRAIGFIQLDIGLQVLIPSSQVPEDLKEYIRYKTQRELAKMRQMMQEEGFKPTTRPATKAVENRDL